MNLDKAKIKNSIIYIYAKTKELVSRQLHFLLNYCKKNDITYSNVYIDTEVSNFLKNKDNLKKLINENSDTVVLISNTDRITRNVFDFIELKNKSNQKNIKFYDISNDMYAFDYLIWNPKEINKGSDESMKNTIDVLLVEPNCLPVKIRIKDELEEYQKLVGGRIQYADLPNCDDVMLICNEDGKNEELPINRDIGYDLIVGTFVIVGVDPDYETNISLTDEQIEKYSKFFDKESIRKTNEDFKDYYKKDKDYEI